MLFLPDIYITKMEKKKILFVCLGNICRSPAAEGIMKKKLEEKGISDRFFIDSAGILNYHEGEFVDNRMRSHARRRNIELTSRSRPVNYNDFYEFDLIIGMDDSNIDALKRRVPESGLEKKIHRMTEYCIRYEADHVPDPYYGGTEGFELVLDLIEDACEGLIQSFNT
jgi:protein-tyrosine phosphatase